MGYETKFLIGKDTGLRFADDNMNFFHVYAVIDMCKMGYSSIISNLPSHLEKGEAPLVYWYAPTGDGDLPIVEDRYGDIPKPIPIRDVLEALEATIEQDKATGSGYVYRRFKWAHALLSSMVDDPEELSVLFYGY